MWGLPAHNLATLLPKTGVLRTLRMIGLALGGAAATAATGWILYPVVKPASSAAELEDAERKLLERIRASGVRLEQRMVRLDAAAGGHEINTLVCRPQTPRPAAPEAARTLVLVHGLGGGVGLWAKNLAPLTAHFDAVFAFDLLGFGRSSRPIAPRGTTAEVQAWWTDSVEAWRTAAAEPELNRPFELCGHSLGAFVAASYAAAHPATVSRLVLAAPVGLHDMAERIERLSPRFRRVIQLVLGLGLNRTKMIGLLGAWPGLAF